MFSGDTFLGYEVLILWSCYNIQNPIQYDVPFGANMAEKGWVSGQSPYARLPARV